MTIKDIAKAANVSPATVSRIINHKDGNISQETRERVLRVIEEHGYVPYAKIRERILFQSRSIGLLIPTLNSAFYMRFASEVQQLAQEHGYSLVLALSSGSTDANISTLDNFSRNRTDGVIICSGSEQELSRLKQLHDQGVAVVALDHLAKPCTLPQLYRDSAEIARSCTQVLLDSNCSRIGLVLRSDCTQALRDTVFSGFSAALTAGNQPIRQNFVTLLDDGFVENFRAMCDLGLDGIVCQDADLARAVYTAAGDRMRIPEDLSVISMEDAPDTDSRSPALTCASTDVARMARMTFECLLSQLSHAPLPFSSQQVVCPIVRRGSIRQRKNAKPRILVAGYINTDVLLRAPGLPRMGRTQVAAHMADYVGGKGANQAYGIGKLGGNVYLLGLLGSDRQGRFAHDHLLRAGVNLDGVGFLPEKPTGTAYISIYPNGKSSVLIDPGANTSVDPPFIRQHEELLRQADFCLSQTDISIDSVVELRRLCRRHQVPMVLSSSYRVPLPNDILDGLYILLIKDEDQKILYPRFSSREACADYLLSAGVENVIFTAGISGCFLANAELRRTYPGYDYPSIDETGTGDVFTGCMVTLLSEGVPLPDAVGAAAWAAAYSTTKLGVQCGFPDRSLLEDVRSGRVQLRFPESDRKQRSLLPSPSAIL